MIRKENTKQSRGNNQFDGKRATKGELHNKEFVNSLFSTLDLLGNQTITIDVNSHQIIERECSIDKFDNDDFDVNNLLMEITQESEN
jgi:hypothetical protein